MSLAMTKKIVKLKEGDLVPENAKFLYAKEEEIYTHSSEKRIHSGFIFDTFQKVRHYETVIYFYYEVDL